jgi:hypothetical protein
MTDEHIFTVLHKAAEDIEPDNCKALLDKRIDKYVCDQAFHQEINMKKRIVKAAAIVAACFLVSGGSVYAAGIITGTVSSSMSGYDYTSYNDIANAGKRTGLSVHTPEAFTNGYEFAGINIVNVADTDAEFNKYNKRKELSVTYSKKENPDITLSIGGSDDSKEKFQDSRIIDGVTAHYSKVETLYLPENEKPTAAETQRAREDSFFEIGYGSDKREEGNYQYISFKKDGETYSLLAMDADNISEEDLCDMTEEVISAK